MVKKLYQEKILLTIIKKMRVKMRMKMKTKMKTKMKIKQKVERQIYLIMLINIRMEMVIMIIMIIMVVRKEIHILIINIIIFQYIILKI